MSFSVTLGNTRLHLQHLIVTVAKKNDCESTTFSTDTGVARSPCVIAKLLEQKLTFSFLGDHL